MKQSVVSVCCWTVVCCMLQTGTGALEALSPSSVASMVKYGTSPSSLTSTAAGSAEVRSFFTWIHNIARMQHSSHGSALTAISVICTDCTCQSDVATFKMHAGPHSRQSLVGHGAHGKHVACIQLAIWPSHMHSCTSLIKLTAAARDTTPQPSLMSC